MIFLTTFKNEKILNIYENYFKKNEKILNIYGNYFLFSLNFFKSLLIGANC